MLPLAEVQKAIFDALTPAVAPTLVLDQAGPNQPYPYVTIGEFIGGQADALTRQGNDLELTIHVWSRQPGFQQAGDLMTAIKNALDRQKFVITGAQWVDTVWNYAQTLRDADGITRHGVLRFRVMLFSKA